MEREGLPKVLAIVVLMVAAVKKYVEKPSLTALTFVPRGLATQSGQSERELAFALKKHSGLGFRPSLSSRMLQTPYWVLPQMYRKSRWP